MDKNGYLICQWIDNSIVAMVTMVHNGREAVLCDKSQTRLGIRNSQRATPRRNPALVSSRARDSLLPNELCEAQMRQRCPCLLSQFLSSTELARSLFQLTHPPSNLVLRLLDLHRQRVGAPGMPLAPGCPTRPGSWPCLWTIFWNVDSLAVCRAEHG